MIKRAIKYLFNNNELLTEFDCEIFINAIDKVIIGRGDECGIKNPCPVTLVFKTGLKVEEGCTAKKSLEIYINDKFIYVI